MVANKKNQTFLSNQKGQALFEFLIFLPFTFIMITVFITMGNSINGAITQQKLLRGYFYYDNKNNSLAPNSSRIYRWKNSAGLTRVGMNVLGWKFKSDSSGLYPISSCYRLNPLLTGQIDETCEDTSSVKGPDTPSAFVRIYTVYGFCGTPYQVLEDGRIRYDSEAWAACALKSN